MMYEFGVRPRPIRVCSSWDELGVSGSSRNRLLRYCEYLARAKSRQNALMRSTTGCHLHRLPSSSAHRLHYPTAQHSIDRLFDIVRHHDDQTAARAAQYEEQRLFHEWSSQIAAREQIEHNRQDPLEFQRARLSGHRFRCRLASVPANEVVGQERIATFGNTRFGLKGTVEGLNDRDLTLVLANTRSDKVPPEGTLVLDTSPSRIKIEREREALRSVRSGAAPLLRGDLGALLLRPTEYGRRCRMRSKLGCIPTWTMRRSSL